MRPGEASGPQVLRLPIIVFKFMQMSASTCKTPAWEPPGVANDMQMYAGWAGTCK